MSKKTLLAGSALTLLGIASYIVTQNAAKAPLYAVVIGVLLLVLGGIALLNDESETKMHISATVLAFLGLLMTAPAWRFAIYMMSVGTRHVDQPTVVIIESLTALILAIYLYFAIAALRQYTARQTNPTT